MSLGAIPDGALICELAHLMLTVYALWLIWCTCGAGRCFYMLPVNLRALTIPFLGNSTNACDMLMTITLYTKVLLLQMAPTSHNQM